MNNKEEQVLGQEQIDPSYNLDYNDQNYVDNFFNPQDFKTSIEMSTPVRMELGRYFEPYGGVKRIDKRLRINDLDDIAEARAQAQTNFEKLSQFQSRAANKFLSEVLKMPGELYGLAEWAASGQFKISSFQESMNNRWINSVDKASQYLNEELFPVYKRREVEEGGFFRQLISPEFWATEGADGVGFLTAFLVPGMALKALGTGSKVIKGLSYIPKMEKFGEAGKLTRLGLKTADKVDDILSVGVNTLVESMAEGSETMNNLKDSYKNDKFKELIKAGYSQEQADELSDKYVNSDLVQDKISSEGYGTFVKNLAILLVPNAIDQQWLFNAWGKAGKSSAIGRRLGKALGSTNDDVLNSIERLTTKQRWGKAAKYGLMGVGKEGFYEEGLQFAASELDKQRALDPDKATNLLSVYADSLGDTDMQKSIFLGALMGGVMGGIHTARSTRREEDYLFGAPAKQYSKFRKLLLAKDRAEQTGIINVLKNNFIRRYQSVEDLYEVKDGVVQKDERGNPKFDLSKLGKFADEVLADETQKEQLHDLALEGDEEGYNYIKNIRDLKYMAPFLQEEGGYDLLKEHINKLAEAELEKLKETPFYNKMTIQEIKTELLEKASRLNNIYKKGERLNFNLFDTNKNNEKYREHVSNAMYDTYVSSEYLKQYIEDRIRNVDSKTSDVISKGFDVKQTNLDTIVPGDVVQIEGLTYQVIQHKDGVTKVVDLNGDLKEINDSDIEEISKATNISPVDRQIMFDSLLYKNSYKEQLNNIQKEYEKLFSKEGQQKIFDTEASLLSNIEKIAKETPKEEVKDKIDDAETKEDLDNIEEEVTESDLDENFKEELLNDIETKKREAEEKEASKEHKSQDDIVKDLMREAFEKGKKENSKKDPDAKETDAEIALRIAKEFKKQQESKGDKVDFGEVWKVAKQIINEQVDQSRQSKEESDDYEIDKRQEGKEDELNKSEEEHGESELKTTQINVAYRAVEYEGKDRLRTKLDSKGNIVFGITEHSIPSLPDMYRPGTKLIAFIDTKQATEKDTWETIPIALQLVDEYGKSEPYLYIHRMDWITNKRVPERFIDEVRADTKKLRETIIKSGKPHVITIQSDTAGHINKPPRGAKNPKQFTLRQVVMDDSRVSLGIGKRTGTLWTDGAVNVLNSTNLLSGIPYLIVPTANGTNFAVWLKQESMKNNPNLDKYNKTVISILEDYSTGGKVTGINNLSDLRKEINKYYHVNTDKLTDELSRDNLMDKEDQNLIFHLQDTKKGLQVVLTREEKGKLVPYNYYYNNGKWRAVKGNKAIQIANMAKELGERLSSKYPNFTKEGVIAGKNFEVWELEGDKLVKNKKDYIDFLSENRVVTTTLQPNIVNGTRTYFSQPNLKLDISSLTEMTEESIKEETKDIITIINDKVDSDIRFRDINNKDKYQTFLDDLSLLGSVMDMSEFYEKHKNILQEILNQDEINLIEDSLKIVDSEKIINFEKLLEQLENTNFTLSEKEMEEAERIEKYCKGIATGRGSIINR